MKYICRKPGKKSVEIIKRDMKVVSPCLTREYSFVYKKAKGCYVWDMDGKKYLDFSSAVAVMNIGHTNHAIKKAINEQIKKGVHCGFSDFYAETPVKFIETLLGFLPGFNNVFLSNSGTESVEAGYKLARWHTRRKYFIAFKPCFHGRSMGSLSMTNANPVQRKRYEPFLPVKHVPYPYYYRMNMEPKECSDYCLSEIEKAIKSVKGNVAGIFFEPVSGEPGYIVPPKAFVKGLRKICTEHGILLCVDEVQAGCYRTGKFLAINHFNVKPDIISMSKAIGGGIPLGATISTKKIMNWVSGSHANTFGGNLLACAAGIATLNYMKKNKLGERATIIGKYIMKRFAEIKDKYDIIADVRGLGLMIGVEFEKNTRKKILCKASGKGLILLPAGESAIRICPPLIITKKQADEGMNILEDSVKEVI